MTLSDWIDAGTFGAGLVLIWVSGFFAGKLWQRGQYVRSVMVGEEPPPWDSEPLFYPSRWDEPRGYSATNTNPPVLVHRGPYDWSQES